MKLDMIGSRNIQQFMQVIIPHFFDQHYAEKKKLHLGRWDSLRLNPELIFHDFCQLKCTEHYIDW